jgi:hypothetical protein
VGFHFAILCLTTVSLTVTLEQGALSWLLPFPLAAYTPERVFP